MSRSKTTTAKVPTPIADALNHHFQSGTLGEYPSRNAMHVGLMLYAAIFPKIHRLTVGIARLPAADQDAIHDFILECVKQGRDIAAMLPKPATAAALPKNAARHSFVSYHLALFGDLALTEMEAGHDRDILFGHYRELVTRAEAEEYFTSTV